ncbi:MAG: hypothetical protein CMD99_07525 [Gammaproteobacteria bacterium]|jgi:hypothetical protein|nr:hypothetical protein [Gammaproteobacteria bacterium]
MFTTSTLLAIASGAIRLGLTYAFWKSFGWLVTLPPAVAGLLLGLAALPDLLKPIPWPLPLSMTLGLVLPDLLLRRA